MTSMSAASLAGGSYVDLAALVESAELKRSPATQCTLHDRGEEAPCVASPYSEPPCKTGASDLPCQHGGQGDIEDLYDPLGDKPLFRSQKFWYQRPDRPDQELIYRERDGGNGVTRRQLAAPQVAIVMAGEVNACNRGHWTRMVDPVKNGAHMNGGNARIVPLPHALFENQDRPTAANHRNDAAAVLAEELTANSFDVMVGLSGCDKTSIAMLMAAIEVDIPVIMMSIGGMNDKKGTRGSGALVWQARRDNAAGTMNRAQFRKLADSSAPSEGHCNSAGTALSNNVWVETVGFMAPGGSSIPATDSDRVKLAFETGWRAVDVFRENLTPSKILSRASTLNGMKILAALGASTNTQVHHAAVTRTAGVEYNRSDWMTYNYPQPLLVAMQPSVPDGVLATGFHNAGGTPALTWEMIVKGEIDGSCLTVTGKTLKENVMEYMEGIEVDRSVIHTYDNPIKRNAGFMVMTGNVFEFLLVKTSGMSQVFIDRFMSRPGDKGVIQGRVIMFNGPEDYRARIDTHPDIDVDCILMMRGAGAKGGFGGMEVANMRAPKWMMEKYGPDFELPCVTDARISGTCGSVVGVHGAPEGAVKGSPVSLLKDGDIIRMDFNNHKLDAKISPEEFDRRRAEMPPLELYPARTYKQKVFRENVGELADGAINEDALKWRKETLNLRGYGHVMPRDNH